MGDFLTAERYNCFDPFPEVGEFDCFYTNPPWGQSNDGESVIVFTERGMEAIGNVGTGMIVIASDHPEIDWTKPVLRNTQIYAASKGFYVSKMMPNEHKYHLRDEHAELPSCNLVISSLPSNSRDLSTAPLSAERLNNFYGRSKELRVRYVLETYRPDYGKANENEYRFEFLEERDE